MKRQKAQYAPCRIEGGTCRGFREATKREGLKLSAADTYRQNAAAERIAASKQNLPHRRQIHERSAERWEEMARAAEETERRAATNAADKLVRAHPQ